MYLPIFTENNVFVMWIVFALVLNYYYYYYYYRKARGVKKIERVACMLHVFAAGVLLLQANVLIIVPDRHGSKLSCSEFKWLWSHLHFPFYDTRYSFLTIYF